MGWVAHGQVRDVGVIALAEGCPRLASLGLHCCRKLTDASAAAIAARLRRLRNLNVSGCMPMSYEAVQARAAVNKFPSVPSGNMLPSSLPGFRM